MYRWLCICLFPSSSCARVHGRGRSPSLTTSSEPSTHSAATRSPPRAICWATDVVHAPPASARRPHVLSSELCGLSSSSASVSVEPRDHPRPSVVEPPREPPWPTLRGHVRAPRALRDLVGTPQQSPEWPWVFSPLLCICLCEWVIMNICVSN